MFNKNRIKELELLNESKILDTKLEGIKLSQKEAETKTKETDQESVLVILKVLPYLSPKEADQVTYVICMDKLKEIIKRF